MFTNSLRNLLLKRTLPVNFLKWNRFLTVTLEYEQKNLIVHDKCFKENLKFPFVWLRDNCYCSECFHFTSKSRKHNWENFDTNVCPKDCQLKCENKQITINWSDGHQSTFDLEWLREHAFTSNHQEHYLNTFYRPKTKHWSGQDFKKICKIFNFKDILHRNDVLKSWLECLAVYGIALIQSAPSDNTVVRQLADRVGFIKKTTYGEEFHVQAKPCAKNVAYLSDPLPLHTDLPYYEYKPGCNLLHCLEQTQSSGGESLLVDAFYIADCMKVKHYEYYRILTQTMVDWRDIGTENGQPFHNIWRAPVIVVDKEENYLRINHSIPQRDSHFTVPIDEVLPWYQAYAKFIQLAQQDAYVFKNQPGNVLTFSNIRLLHGRTGYNDTKDNLRHLIGAYVDWDIIYSKLRVLNTTTKNSY